MNLGGRHRPFRCVMATRGAALAAVAQLFLVPAASTARIVPLGGAVQANTTFVPGDTYSQEPPGLVTLPDGGFVVIWDGVGPPNQPPAVGRHFDATNTAVGPEFPLPGVIGVPPIAAVDGRLIAGLYSEQLNAQLGAFTLDGVAQITQPVETPAGTTVHALAVTSSGDLVLMWTDSSEVVGQRFGAEDLQPSGAPFTVVASSDDVPFDLPVVASDPSGGFVTAWTADMGDALWARQFDGQNVPLGDPFQVVDPTELAELSGGPSVCVDDSGQFVVGWHDEDHPIEFRRFDAQGNPLTTRLSTAIGGLDGAPVACLTEHRIVVAGVGPAEVTCRAFDAQNRPMGHFAVPDPYPAFTPTVAAFPDDTFVVAWDQCVTGATPGCNVFAQRFMLAPGLDCPGDLNGDGQVTIDEILFAVNVALNDAVSGPDASFSCRETAYYPALDTDLNCHITIVDILAAVSSLLKGCLQL